MGLFSGRASAGDTCAGLFVFGGVMQYVEIGRARDGSYSVRECLDAPCGRGDSSGEPFAEQGRIESNLKALKRLVGGKWASAVLAGIQSRDVLLRAVELPAMDRADMRDAFRYEFDRHFPIPAEDAVYDITPIDHPEPDPSGATRRCLAAAVRGSSVENLVLAARSAGLRLKGIEPAPVAGLRSLMGPSSPAGFNLYALAGAASSIIIAAYRDNGVVYRNTNQSFAAGAPADVVANFARELQATANFAATQMRGFNAGKVYIGGYGAIYADALRAGVSEVLSAPVEIVNPWTAWNIASPPGRQFGWEVPLGLALRPSAEAM